MLLRALHRWLLRTIPVNDPWVRIECQVPLARYGAGARRDFAWYFEGESRVVVSSVEEVCAWLKGCRYVRDTDLFFETDFWQHPCTFERLRQGDCEDHALWAWRKLVELGYAAEFVVGRSREPDGPGRGHAWVHLEREGQRFLLDAAATAAPTGILRPWEVARCEYLPEVSIDHRLRRFVYGGYARVRLRCAG